MSSQQTVNGYIGTRSSKLSSLYADNYVIPRATSVGGFSDDGSTLVTPLTPAGNPVLDVNSITIQGIAGFFTTGVCAVVANEISRILVHADSVGAGSLVLVQAEPVTAYDAEYADLAVTVGFVSNGTFEVAFANNTAADTTTQAYTINYIILNPSA